MTQGHRGEAASRFEANLSGPVAARTSDWPLPAKGASEESSASPTNELQTDVPVLLLGGRENSLAVTRNLGRHGIRVRMCGSAMSFGLHSRYCHEALPVPGNTDEISYWQSLLLDAPPERLRGSVLWPCNDEAIDFTLAHYQELRPNFILDAIQPKLQRLLMDKKATLELARAVGVPTPNFWTVSAFEDVDAILPEVSFPAMVKPLHSHIFAREFGRKLFIVESSPDDLRAKARLSLERGHPIMIVEMIPGPDDRLSSYYTYIDADDQALFHFTKRVLRRFPVNRGGACYHETKWLPETADLGRRFFTEIGFRGLGNIEFKRDERDGRLKVIEVNPRFTAAHELLVRAGLPIDIMIYRHLTGQPPLRAANFAEGMRMWYPIQDFYAFRQLNRRGQLGFGAWLKSVARAGQIFPTYSFRDPRPFLVSTASMFKRYGKMSE